jgi:hypothetical protein
MGFGFPETEITFFRRAVSVSRESRVTEQVEHSTMVGQNQNWERLATSQRIPFIKVEVETA